MFTKSMIDDIMSVSEWAQIKDTKNGGFAV